MTDFVGDGKHAGDGGQALQRLWDKWPWKPVPNQPGRYSMRRVGDGVPPEALCETAGIKKMKMEKVKKGTDQVVLVELEDGGGGIVTIINADGTYAHTLNTKSNFVKFKSG